MKLEKRSSEGTETPVETPSSGKKPVVMYIMILFIAAFLLMALSFVIHQRSNTEVLGELQSSVSAMQEVQDAQDKIIALQEELSAAEKQQTDLETQLETAQQETQAAQQRTDALLALYRLQQQYSAGDFNACRETLQNMADAGLVAALSTESQGDVTSPAQRYEQLKEVILNH